MALTFRVLLAWGLALGAGPASAQTLDGDGNLGPLVVPFPDDDWVTLGPSGEGTGSLVPAPRLESGPPGWAMPAPPDAQAGSLSDRCPACGEQPSGPLSGPTGRHRGLGRPLTCESWRFRPFSAGWFIGALEGGSLLDDWVGGKHGFLGGYRLGWDYDHYWGCEMRFAFGNVALCDSQRAKDAQRAVDDAQGIPDDDPFRDRFQGRRDATLGLWDVSLLYYPWGDAAWRPYLMLGLGSACTEFIDRLSIRYRETAFAMPLALGLKYRLSNCTSMRMELADNIAFGGSLDGVHYVSLTAGMEIRFGGSRVAYWPWNPSRHYW